MIVKPSYSFISRAHEKQRNGASPLMGVSRASGGYSTNAIGLMERKPPGFLRHDYDAATGEYKGVLVEEARTNTLWPSEDFAHANWMKSNCTVAAAAGTGPDGTVGLNKIMEDTGASTTHCVQLPVAGSYAAGQPYTAQAVVKSGTRSAIGIRVMGSAWANQGAAYFDLTAGVKTGNFKQGAATIVGGNIISLGGGLYLIWITVTLGAADTYCGAALSLLNSASGLQSSESYTGQGSGYYAYASCVQLEAGNGPGSYIKTTNAAATRAQDVISIPVASFLGGVSPNEGTLFVERDFTTVPQNGYYDVVQLDDNAGNNNRLNILVSNGYVNANILVGGVGAGSTPGLGGIVAGTTYKIAVPYKVGTNGLSLVVNGTVIGSGNVTSLPALNTLRVADYYGFPPNGRIRAIQHFPRALSLADCQTITG